MVWRRRVTAAAVSFAFAGGAVGMLASPAHAQELEPFGCMGDGILTQAEGGEIGEVPSDVNFVDMASGDTETEFTLDTQVNAIGYNANDGLVYGWNNDPDNRGLVRFGANGVLETVTTPPELGTGVYLVGDVDDNGHHWLMQPGTGDWYQVEVPSGTLIDSGTADMPDGLSVGADWAWVPGTDSLYQTFFDDETTYLYRFDRTTQEYELVGDAGIDGQQFGALYAAPDGYVYGSANGSGEIWRFDIATGEGELFAEGFPSEHNDGARCATAEIPVDFGDAPDSYGALVASDGPRHSVPEFDEEQETGPLVLGTNVSIEPNGQPSAAADLDTYDDGVDSPMELVVGTESTVSVFVTNETDEVATLAGWVDLDGDGTFDPGERQMVTVDPNTTGEHELTFPAGTTGEDTYARFRLYGGEVEDPSPTGAAASGEVEDYLVTNLNDPSLALEKSASPTEDLEVGDVVTYTYTATNDGNVPLTEVVIEEMDFSGAGELSALACDQTQPAVLAPGEQQVCTATYEVVQADVDAGEVSNAATVTGETPPGDSEGPPPEETIVQLPPEPSLTVDKSVSPAGQVDVGDAIVYTFTAVNDGNVTLSDVTIEDVEFSGDGDLSALVCDATQPAVLAPGEELVCVAEYTATEGDAGQELLNVAVATGTPPESPEIETTGNATVDVVDPDLPVTGMSTTSKLVPAGTLMLLLGAGILVAVRLQRRRATV